MRLIDADTLVYSPCFRVGCDKAGDCQSCKLAVVTRKDIDNAPTVTPEMAQMFAYGSGKTSKRKKPYKDLCETCKLGDTCGLSTMKIACDCRTTQCSQYKRRLRQ